MTPAELDAHITTALETNPQIACFAISAPDFQPCLRSPLYHNDHWFHGPTGRQLRVYLQIAGEREIEFRRDTHWRVLTVKLGGDRVPPPVSGPRTREQDPNDLFWPPVRRTGVPKAPEPPDPTRWSRLLEEDEIG